MGHDNENWVESYLADDNIFATKPKHQEYASRRTTTLPPEMIIDAADLMSEGKIKEALAVIEQGMPRESLRAKDDALAAVIERLASMTKQPPLSFAPKETEAWNLRPTEPIHFVHVNDVGGYDHDTEKDFAKYGYVIAQLDEGRPISLQGYNLGNNAEGALFELLKS